MPPFTPLFIDGKEVPASNNATFEVLNASTSKVVGISASASSADCTAAVEAAGRAFKTWEQTTPYDRRDLFLKAADIVSSDRWRDLVVQTAVEELNCHPAWAMNEWMGAPRLLRTVASFSNSLTGTTFVSSSIPGTMCEMRQRAMGVIFGIAPWNAPFALTIRAFAVPLMCGNAVVVKSSEYSPRTQLLAVQLFVEAGFPAGVVNYISMSRESSPELTAQIIAHPLVRKINFTGSDRVGRIIATEAAKHLKPTVLELGGKAPAVVLNDASIPDAANAIVWGAMLHSGQICMSTERVIVQRGAAEALMAQVKTLSESLTAGESGDAKLRPLFSQGSAQNVLAMLSEAQGAGAELLLGDLDRQGAVVRPHLVTGVKPGMRLWDRESFGPVIVFAVVDTPEEAVELANASDYTLCASLWTNDMYLAQRIAPLIRAGEYPLTLFDHKLSLLPQAIQILMDQPSMESENLVSAVGLGGSSGYGHFGIEDFTDKRVIATHPLGREFPFLK
ncbi:Aldedh domain-containing protein [Mycena sanguinolenta]|uniref:Aldedh domain-containing protein n=1 Tax=Mycena sanguinolenta TaxID=230812 RepID=A0A8H7CEI6_9AGAR|nr:Aldedh domain-containing protein [Mycena sanguinolenta]